MDSGSIPDISTLRPAIGGIFGVTLCLMGFLDLIFPKTCAGCGKKGNYFCPECVAKIKKVWQICPVCEKPTPFGQTHNFCLTRNSLDGLFSLFVYDGIIRSAVHQLKYKFVTDLEDDFWQLIKETMKRREEETVVLRNFVEKETPLIVPVPLYWYKQNLRGFNQSSFFGKRLADYYNLPFSDKILVRRKNSVSQTKLTQKERAENVKGIFSMSPVIARIPSVVEGDEAISILLVDDVWTTGATMKEATGVLKEAGVKKVWGLTIAR